MVIQEMAYGLFPLNAKCTLHNAKLRYQQTQQSKLQADMDIRPYQPILTYPVVGDGFPFPEDISMRLPRRLWRLAMTQRT